MSAFGILIVLPLITAGLCYTLKNLRLQYAVTMAAASAHLVMSGLVFAGALQPQMPVFFAVDSLSRLFIPVLSNVFFWTSLVSYSYLKKPSLPGTKEGTRNYFMLLNFYLAANSAAILSDHFGMYWVAVEATTLSVAPLIYFYHNEEALEAMWKYLFLVSIGIAFAFIGILLLTLSAKGTSLEGAQLFFWEYIKGAAALNPVWLKASFIFIFAGLSAKIGIAPMHSGDVDATSNAPSPVAALMSGSLRITALLGVMRIFQILRPTSSYEFARVILIIGALLSVFVAFIFMFKVNNYKRMLAYSSVEHLGIITLGLGIGGIAFIGAIYHLIYNSVIKVALFLTAGSIHREYKTREVAKIKGVLNRMPKTGWLFMAAFMAISGIPPFGVFFSELKIFEGALFSDKPLTLILLLLFMLFIFINMGKITFGMLYGRGDESSQSKSTEKIDIINITAAFLLLLSAVIAVSAPECLWQNILAIARDFGVNL